VNAAAPSSIKSDVDSHTLFVNAYYDIETGTAFTPYVGGGIGAAWNHTDAKGTAIATGASENFNKTTANFAWNLAAGCSYDLTDNWKLSAGYRYLDLGKVEWGNDVLSLKSDDITAHEVTVGLRYQF